MTLAQTIQIFKPEIPPLEMKFSRIMRSVSRFNLTRNMQTQSTCAIVGNSGVLLDSSCGPLIDSSDFVIRMNLALFGGTFALDVGSRVNLMTLNSQQYREIMNCTSHSGNATLDGLSCRDLMVGLRGTNGSTLWYFGSVTHNERLTKALDVLRRSYDLHHGFAYSPGQIKSQVQKISKLRVPSTGIMVYSATTHFCSEIRLFGFFPFYKDPTNRTLNAHYYDNKALNYTTNIHKIPEEFKLLLDLDKEGALRLINDCEGKWDNDVMREKLKGIGRLDGSELSDGLVGANDLLLNDTSTNTSAFIAYHKFR